MARPTPAEKLAILARRERVAALALAGKTERQIAELVQVAPSTVHSDLVAIRRDWKARAAAHHEERVARRLAELDFDKAEAMAGWERSQRDAETRHVRTETEGVGPDGKPIPAKTISEKTTKGQAGDPRFLSEFRQAIHEQLLVQGDLAPTKVAPTTPEGDAPYDPGTAGDPELVARFLSIVERLPPPGDAGGAVAGDPPVLPGGDGPRPD